MKNFKNKTKNILYQKVKALFLKAMKNGRNFLIAVNIVGIIFITINNAYYSYGVMIYKVSFKEANDDFWSSELLFCGIFVIILNGLALIAWIRNRIKNKTKNDK